MWNLASRSSRFCGSSASRRENCISVSTSPSPFRDSFAVATETIQWKAFSVGICTTKAMPITVKFRSVTGQAGQNTQMGLLEFLWLICEVSLPSRCNWNTMLLAFSEPVGSTIFQDIVWGWSRWKTHGLTIRIPRRTHFNISCFACTSGSSRETQSLVTKILPLAQERGGERGDRGGDSGGEKVSRERICRDPTDRRLPASTWGT